MSKSPIDIMVLTKYDEELLGSMGIAGSSNPDLIVTIHKPVTTFGRLARLKHLDGTETRQLCLSQDEAIAWIGQHFKSGDDVVIDSAELT
jgi:hypothetical protein